jgi:hypothetical protein
MPHYQKWRMPFPAAPFPSGEGWNCWGLRVKKTIAYAERDEEKRAAFLAEIECINPADLIYLDESGIDANLQRNYARAIRGKQVISEVCGKKTARTSMIAAWVQHKKSLIAPYVFSGYTDSKRFNDWLEEELLPQLRTGQVVVMDNASFHRGKRTKELIESVGCRLLYLPPYWLRRPSGHQTSTQ